MYAERLLTAIVTNQKGLPPQRGPFHDEIIIQIGATVYSASKTVFLGGEG